MSDPEKKICRYFNTIGGCWYGDSCKFLHIPNKKPPCKFYGSSTGCRYGDSCHFSHDRTPFKSVENYNNAPTEHMKEAFKENMDPSELSGTNNNNMTQPMAGLTSSGQQQSQPLPLLSNASQSASQCQISTSNGTNDIMLTDEQRYSAELNSDHVIVSKDDQTGCETVHSLSDQTTEQTTASSTTATVTTQPFRPETDVLDPSADGLLAMTETQTTSTTSRDPMLAHLAPSTTSLDANQAMNVFKQNTLNAELAMRDMTGAGSACATRAEDGQNYALTPVNGRSNGMTSDIEIYCGSCKRILERRGNESYCTLLKDHYLECFLDKEGDHVKYVKTKAALEPGQMYWCKSCILIFEKPWSLFQHMADKAKGNKVQRWEKKIHLDWMDSVAGLMAGYDLGLFSPAKLRIDLRNLLADYHTMEEEMEAAAVTAAAMMQWFAPLSNPWRLQQREMMRKIEQLNRQMLRKANIGLNAAAGGYPMRAALTAAPVTQAGVPNTTQPLNYAPNHRNIHATSLPTTQAPARLAEVTLNGETAADMPSRTSPIRSNTANPASSLATDVLDNDAQVTGSAALTNMEDPESVGPLGDGEVQAVVSCDVVSGSPDQGNTTGAAGDIIVGDTELNSNKMAVDATCNLTELTESNDPNQTIINSNNTNSAHGASARGDDGGRRVEFKRGNHSSSNSYTYPGTKSSSTGGTSKGYGDSMRYQLHARGSRTPGYGHSSGSFGPAHRGMHRLNRMSAGTSVPPSRAANSFNPPSFHASLDLNCGFTDDEVEELLSQGIKPWDSEAAAALAVLRGELDHLLD